MPTRQIPDTPPPGLVCASLTSMANKGFETACLIRMQDLAFRAAAQSIQHRIASGIPTTSDELNMLVNQHFAGKDAQTDSGDVTGNHIANYMFTKGFLSQSHPRHLVRDAQALSRLDLPAPIYGKEAQPMCTLWLAQHLVALHDHAVQATEATPMFAKSLHEQAVFLEATYRDRPSLKEAIELVKGFTSFENDLASEDDVDKIDADSPKQ